MTVFVNRNWGQIRKTILSQQAKVQASHQIHEKFDLQLAETFSERLHYTSPYFRAKSYFLSFLCFAHFCYYYFMYYYAFKTLPDRFDHSLSIFTQNSSNFLVTIYVSSLDCCPKHCNMDSLLYILSGRIVESGKERGVCLEICATHFYPWNTKVSLLESKNYWSIHPRLIPSIRCNTVENYVAFVW